MLKNIINSAWSTIVEPIQAFDIQVHDKECNRNHNIFSFALMSYEDWKYFKNLHDYILDNLYEISNSEIYSHIKGNPYIMWFFINKFRLAICFIYFLKITTPPKRLHEELFGLFYESGIKKALENDNYHLGETFHTEDRISKIIHRFMQYAVETYKIDNGSNEESILDFTILLTREIYEAFKLDCLENEKALIEKVLVEYANIIKTDIFSKFIKANKRNEIV
jgi:hypothetical protein